MICISRLNLRNSFGATESRSLPANRTSPEVGSISLRIERPVVDFPHPDSPTSPNVSPRRIVKLTSSTALTTSRPAPSRLLPAGKCFVRFLTSIRFELFSLIENLARFAVLCVFARNGFTYSARLLPGFSRYAQNASSPNHLQPNHDGYIARDVLRLLEAAGHPQRCIPRSRKHIEARTCILQAGEEDSARCPLSSRAFAS